jgi:hypothetical protein
MIPGNDENEKGRRRARGIGTEIVSAIVIENGTRTGIESGSVIGIDDGTTTTDHIGATTTTTSHRGDMTSTISTSPLREDMTMTIDRVAISLPEIIQMTGTATATETEAEIEIGIEIETGIRTGIASETATKTATKTTKETARGIGIKTSRITQTITHHLAMQYLAAHRLTTQQLTNARKILGVTHQAQAPGQNSKRFSLSTNNLLLRHRNTHTLTLTRHRSLLTSDETDLLCFSYLLSA